MACARCAHDVWTETSPPPSSLGLASRVAMSAVVCPECGGPTEEWAGDAVLSRMVARLDRFAFAGRRPLLEQRREVA